MGLFDIFKKKKEEPKIEKISKKELKDWILAENSKILREKSELLDSVKEKIEKLTSELNQQIDYFRTIDVESKTPNHRAKAMAKENLRNYESYLEKMIERLNEINNIDNLIENINIIIKDFEEKSNLSYQKISALLGREVKGARNQLRVFLKEIEEILKSNQKRLDEFEKFEKVKNRINEINQAKESMKELKKELEEDEKKKSDLVKEIKNKEKEIEKIKDSEKYKEYKARKEKLQQKKRDFEKNLLDLKSEIDFKSLTSFYHKFENEMELVKKYKDDFSESIKQNGFDKLLKLLQESNKINDKIKNKIEKLKKEKEEISNFKIEKINFVEIEGELKNKKIELENLKMGISLKEKKMKDFIEDVTKEEKLMEMGLKEMDVYVED